MTSVGSNFTCGRPHGADPTSTVRICPPEPDSPFPPSGRHKWMAPNLKYNFIVGYHNLRLHTFSFIYLVRFYSNYHYHLLHRHLREPYKE